MNECPNLQGCPFVKYGNSNHSSMSIKGFINMFCKGGKQEQCIRKQLCGQFSKSVVPLNMMPNGMPLPGTNKDHWSVEALNYRKHLANV